MSKLFIGGLSWNTDDISLKDGFSKYGEIVDAIVIKDRETGMSFFFFFFSLYSLYPLCLWILFIILKDRSGDSCCVIVVSSTFFIYNLS